jgi:molybdopterin converting factor subunit 1
MNHIMVLFFANLRDYAGSKSLPMEIPIGSDVKTLKKLLVRQNADLEQALQTVLVSINHEYAFDEDVVPDGAEVALFPPVSGG